MPLWTKDGQFEHEGDLALNYFNKQAALPRNDAIHTDQDRDFDWGPILDKVKELDAEEMGKSRKQLQDLLEKLDGEDKKRTRDLFFNPTPMEDQKDPSNQIDPSAEPLSAVPTPKPRPGPFEEAEYNKRLALKAHTPAFLNELKKKYGDVPEVKEIFETHKTWATKEQTEKEVIRRLDPQIIFEERYDIPGHLDGKITPPDVKVFNEAFAKVRMDWEKYRKSENVIDRRNATGGLLDFLGGVYDMVKTGYELSKKDLQELLFDEKLTDENMRKRIKEILDKFEP